MIFYNVVCNLKFRKGKIMNFVTGDYDIVGTCLQGTIDTSYDRLVEVFGKPNLWTEEETDGKISCDWVIKFTDGTLATIYDWKEDIKYDRVTKWHIGGHSKAAVYNVIDEVI